MKKKKMSKKEKFKILVDAVDKCKSTFGKSYYMHKELSKMNETK